ncbi:MAG: hypothetical protein Alpg2KO_20050 [Alphaproteobacteria bacterium]
MALLKLVPDETKVDFLKLRIAAYLLSAVAVFGSIGLIATQGLAFGIDFVGGTVLELETADESPADLAELRIQTKDLGLGDISLQEFGEPHLVLLRLQQQGDNDSQQVAIQQVLDAVGEGYELRRNETVGPQVGDELIEAGITAVLLSLAGILIYIWVRFEWQFGLAAVVALMHDVLIILGLFSILKMEFNLSTVAAVLTIAGYSINDTVVVFDRVRENMRKYKKMELRDLFNLSLNQTLSRTLMTSITTLLALFSLWLFGGEVIRGFTDALLWGVMIGTYSSIFVAVPVLLLFPSLGKTRQNFEEEKVGDEPEGAVEAG